MFPTPSTELNGDGGDGKFRRHALIRGGSRGRIGFKSVGESGGNKEDEGECKGEATNHKKDERWDGGRGSWTTKVADWCSPSSWSSSGNNGSNGLDVINNERRPQQQRKSDWMRYRITMLIRPYLRWLLANMVDSVYVSEFR